MLVPIVTPVNASFNAENGFAYLVPLTTGTPVCTLPDATLMSGQVVSVTVISATNARLSFATVNSQLVNNQSVNNLPGLTSSGSSYTFISDGSNWETKNVCFGFGPPSSIPMVGGAPSLTFKMLTSGQATFTSSNSVFVSDATISASSIVVVTAVGSPAVAEEFSVSVSPGSGFTVNSTNVSSTATVNYIRLK